MNILSVKACFVVPIYKNLIMIQQRPDNTWGFFGGSISNDETWPGCIRREFFEETGVQLKLSLLGNPLQFEDYVVYPYYCMEKIMGVVPNIETISFSWVKLEDLKELNLKEEFKNYLFEFLEKFKVYIKK